MKRKASRPAPYEIPTKLTKRTTTTTISRNLSTLRRTVTTPRAAVPPPKWPSMKAGSPPAVLSPPSLPTPKWPTLVPTSKAGSRKGAAAVDPSTSTVTEISEEPSSPVPGLRRMSTLPLEENEEAARGGAKRSKTVSSAGSRALSKTGSSSSSMSGLPPAAVVATLEKKGSVVTLDTSGTVTTVTRLASGSSVGETTALSAAPPSICKELSKAASAKDGSAGAALVKKLSSIRVFGSDAPEEEEGGGEEELAPSLGSRSSSVKSKRDGSVRREASLATSSSTALGADAPAVPLPPGGLIEIAFSFDTTGSMSSCIEEVRGRVGDMIQRLQADIPGIRISVIAHGDYCDAPDYVIKWIDFGASLPELSDFVQNVHGTAGGDFDECYELVLARAQTELSWTPGSQRALVMIGDATPHPPSYYNSHAEKLDWMVEAQKVGDMGVKIYAVQALNRGESTTFYQTLAGVTRGRHLKLDQFSNIFDIIMAVCYNEKGAEFVQAYEEEVRAREGGGTLHHDLEGVFSAFRGGKPAESAPLSTVKKPRPTTGKPAVKVTTAKGKAKPPKGAAKSKAASKTTATAKAKGKAMTAAKTKGKNAATSKTKGKTSAATKTKGKTTAAAKAKGKTSGAAKTKGKTTASAKAKGKATAAKVKAKAGAKAAAKKAKGKGVKSVKGRKPAKGAAGKKRVKAAAAKKTKKPVPGVQRKFREAVKDEELSQGSCLKKVQWDPWIKALLFFKPRGKDVRKFSPRVPAEISLGPVKNRSQRVRVGLRNVSIMKYRQNVPAVFEVAVQMKPGKRYVMSYKAFCSWRPRLMWDTILFNTTLLNAEVNAVLRSGGQIWVRRGTVKSPDVLKDVTAHLTKHFDYAWAPRGKMGRAGDKHHRRVKKCATLISGNEDV